MRPDTRGQLLRLLDLLYAAPGDRTGWETFLQAVCTALDGRSAQFVAHASDIRSAEVGVSIHLEGAAIRDYEAYWGQHDPWARSEKARALVRPGAVVAGDQLVSPADLQRTAYYNEYGLKYDVTQTLAGIIELEPNRLSFLAVSGDRARRSFAGDDIHFVEQLMPHLQRALQLHRRLSEADSVAHTAIDALERSNHAVCVLGRDGRVMRSNSLADAILRAGDGVTVERGELRTASPDSTRRLRALIHGAIETSRGVGVGAGGVLLIGRPSRRPPLRVVVSPLPRPLDPLGSTALGALLLITDPDRRPIPDEDTIRIAFGLTRAEARLARALADGLTVDEAANHLRITVGTARTRLKTIFEKTGLHRQLDLVRAVVAS